MLSSRDVLIAALTRSPPAGRLGLIAPESHGFEEFEGLELEFLADDPAPYAEVDGIVMMSSVPWTDARQALLETALTRNPRPVWVGNPDLVAPRETGLTLEPGHYAHRLADATGITPEFFGKPYGNVFDTVRGAACRRTWTRGGSSWLATRSTPTFSVAPRPASPPRLSQTTAL